MPADLIEIKKESDIDIDSPLTADSIDRFPFGSSLHFEGEMLEELGINELSVGDVIEVRGFAVIESKSERTDQQSTDKSMGLQMTFIKVTKETDDRAESLYGASSHEQE